MTHLVMFDIDGTLVDSMGFDTDLYVRAVRAELGFEFVAIGKTVAHEPRLDDYSDRDAVLACVLGEGRNAPAG